MPARVTGLSPLHDTPAGRTNDFGGAFSGNSQLDSPSLIAAPAAAEMDRFCSVTQSLDEPVVKKWPVFMSFIFPALGGLLFGYDIGATSFVVVQLESSDYSGVSWSSAISDSSVWRGVITSGSVGGAFLVSFLVFPLSEVLGRRGEMLIGACLYMLGGLLEALAAVGTLSETAALFLLVSGRLVFGMGIGFTMHAVPIYISESMPSNVRGMFISAKEAAIVGGMVADTHARIPPPLPPPQRCNTV